MIEKCGKAGAVGFSGGCNFYLLLGIKGESIV